MLDKVSRYHGLLCGITEIQFTGGPFLSRMIQRVEREREPVDREMDISSAV